MQTLLRLGSSHPDVADSLNSLATVLWRQGRGAEAETTEREALVLYRKLLGNEHPAVAMALDNLAAMLSTQDKLAQA